MQNNLYIAGTAEGLVTFLVIAGWIIVQIIKSSKRMSQSDDQPAQKPAEAYTAPKEELKKFLETLTGGGQPPPVKEAPSLPTPSPTHTPPPIQHTRRASPAPPPRTTAQPSQAADAAIPHKAPVRQDHFKRTETHVAHEPTEEYVTHESASEVYVKRIRKSLGNDLVGVDSLRKAVLLREVLGPPLALRD